MMSTALGVEKKMSEMGRLSFRAKYTSLKFNWGEKPGLLQNPPFVLPILRILSSQTHTLAHTHTSMKYHRKTERKE